jgi:26S proteasome regulatory subunit N10
MKKNNVSIDFIAFGELEGENTKKLEAFNENVKGGDGSHLAIIPPGPHLLSDALVTSPILGGDPSTGMGAGGAGADGADGGANSFEFGVDPSMEPELALALRMSLEEEKARLEKEKKEKEEEAASKSNLEGIPEEGQAGSSAPKDGAADGQKDDAQGGPKNDDDKMDMS